MEIIITEEMKQEALRKRQEADAFIKGLENDPEDPENPVCIGCI